MRVCDVFDNGTNLEPSNGGFGGDFGCKQPKSPPKPKTRYWKLAIGNVPEKGDWEVIAENAGWWLRLNADTRHAGWRSVKLGSKVERVGGANFVLAWNGERFAGSSDYGRLVERFPEAAEWAIEKLRLGNVR